MSFKEQLDNDLDIFFNSDEFAEEVVFVSSESGTMNVKVIIEYLQDLEISSDGNHQSAIVYMKRTDLNPNYMDKIYINAKEWKIEQIQENNNVAKLLIRTKERIYV